MAKIKFGMMMTDARGKLGGQVFSKNRNGAYVRTKVTPSNPRTASQQANRSLLGSLSQQWSGLQQSVRDAFDQSVADWQRTNIFGDATKPTGKNLFVRLNKNRLAAGYEGLIDSPTKLETPILTMGESTINTTNGVFNLAVFGASPDVSLTARITPLLSNGTTFTKGKYRTFWQGTAGTLSAGTLYTALVGFQGIPVIDGNYSVEVFQTLENGQTTIPVTAKVVVS